MYEDCSLKPSASVSSVGNYVINGIAMFNMDAFTTRMIKSVVFALMLPLSAVACSNPRGNLHASDSQEIYQLSKEKRKQYDVLFFNEFSVFTHNRPGINECQRREKLFRQMAEEGYEVAGIALQLYDIGRCDDRDRYDEAARERLEELAERGDTAAVCFLYPYFPGQRPTKGSDERARWVEYLEDGAQQEHPGCMFWLSTLYWRGVDGFVKDTVQMEKWLVEAARGGDLRAQSRLGWRYRMGEGVTKDLTKALCWARVAAETGDESGSNTYKGDLDNLEGRLRRSGKSDLIEAQNERERRNGKACDL